MASVRPTKIVSRNVATSTAASPREARSNVATALRSTMFQATTASTPASAASGMKLASGAASSTNASRNSECSMPATGPCAPARTFVAVRAIVPVTQMPPNRLDAMLATPCATSSQFERCRRPVMPSATTADSSDSIAPSNANATAFGSTSRTLLKLTSGRPGSGNVFGMPPKREPIVVTSRLSDGARRRQRRHGDQHARPLRPPALERNDDDDRCERERHRHGIERRQERHGDRQLVEQLAGLRPVERQPQQILQLAREDDDGDAGGEADGDRIRDELDVGAELEKADRREQHSGEQRREQQTVEAVRLHRRRDEHDERARRAADLKPAAAERRDHEAADDRGVQALRRRGARRDCDRHRQGQRDDRHRERRRAHRRAAAASRSPRAAP